MLVPQVLGSIRALFPSEAELAKALSFYGVMMGLAASIGHFSGGALVEWSPFGWGWRAVFLAKLPSASRWHRRLGHDARDQQQPSPSARYRRCVLISLTLACLVLPLSEGRQQGWPAWTFLMLAAVPFLAAAFLGSRRGWQPMPAVRCSTSPADDPSFRRGVLVGTLFFFTTSFYVLFASMSRRATAPTAVHRPRHPALRRRLVRRPLGHRAAGPPATLAAHHRHGDPGHRLRRRRRW